MKTESDKMTDDAVPGDPGRRKFSIRPPQSAWAAGPVAGPRFVRTGNRTVSTGVASGAPMGTSSRASWTSTTASGRRAHG